jgi:hypothetical protein
VKKLILLTILVTCILPLCVQAQMSKPIDAYVFNGMIYTHASPGDTTGGWSTVFGAAKRITGGLWSLNRGEVGKPGATIESDIAYFWKVQPVFRVGVTGGPLVTWIGDESPLTYVMGAGGLIANCIWEFKNQSVIRAAGFSVGAKYKWSFQGDDMVKDGWQVFATVDVGL